MPQLRGASFELRGGRCRLTRLVRSEEKYEQPYTQEQAVSCVADAVILAPCLVRRNKVNLRRKVSLTRKWCCRLVT